MTLDIYKNVNFNVGQEARAVDSNDAQLYSLSRLFDQVLHELAPGSLLDNGDPEFRASDAATKWAYALTATGGAPIISAKAHITADKKIKVSAGTLMQKVANADGDEPQLIPFTFDGTMEFTLDNGHATLSRVDIVQMKLEWVDDDSQSRVFSTEGDYSVLDLDPLTSNIDTVVQSRVKGVSGDQIRIRFVSDGALSLVEESPFDVTINYDSGVTTVADVEALIDASSTLLVVQTTGTGANVLSSPGDTLAYTNLAGGVDAVLVSQNLYMKRRVQATVSVKTGTAAASPAVIPEPDSGYVPLYAIAIPATWAAGAGFSMSYDDRAAGADLNGNLYATVMDLRMPINVKKYTTTFRDGCFYDETQWVRGDNNGNHMTLMSLGSADTMTVHASGLKATVDGNTHQMTVSAYVNTTGSGDLALHFELPPFTQDASYMAEGNPTYEIVSAGYKVYGDGASDVTTSHLLQKQRDPEFNSTVYNFGGDTNPPASVTTRSQTIGGVYIDPETSDLFFYMAYNGANIRFLDAWVVLRQVQRGSFYSNFALDELLAPLHCPGNGRLIGISMVSQGGGAGPYAEAHICGLSGSGQPKDLVRVAGFASDIIGEATGLPEKRHGGIGVIEDDAETDNLIAKAGTSYGVPTWTNGMRAPFREMTERYQADESYDASQPDRLALRIVPISEFGFFSVTFYVAEGL